MRVEGKPEFFMFKANGRAPNVQWRVQCPPDIQTNPSHNSTGGSNPAPTNKYVRQQDKRTLFQYNGER